MTAPIFTAIDTTEHAKAQALAKTLYGLTHLKLGLEFVMAQGPQGIASLDAPPRTLFIDMKLHDIPNTVAGAVKSLLPLRPGFITVHAAGGAAMMRAAVEAAATVETPPKILAVTILTSLDEGDLAALEQPGPLVARVTRYAQMAEGCGCAGIVAAPTEVAALRSVLAPKTLVVTPGIRPAAAARGDQKRTLTPHEALGLGADYLVIGRPITTAPDPAEAARAIIAEISHAAHA